MILLTWTEVRVYCDAPKPTLADQMKLYQALANKVYQLRNLRERDMYIEGPEADVAQISEVRDQINQMVADHLPHGSGFDNGTKIDLDASTDNKLVFHTSFHHMNEWGSYDGWTEHRVTVRGSLLFDVTITVSGRDRNEINDYISELFHDALTGDVEWPLPLDKAKHQAAVEYAHAHPIGTTPAVVQGDDA